MSQLEGGPWSTDGSLPIVFNSGRQEGTFQWWGEKVALYVQARVIYGTPLSGTMTSKSVFGSSSTLSGLLSSRACGPASLGKCYPRHNMPKG